MCLVDLHAWQAAGDRSWTPDHRRYGGHIGHVHCSAVTYHCAMMADAKLVHSLSSYLVHKFGNRICLAHRCKVPLMHYCFSYVGADLRSQSTARHTRTLWNHGYEVVYHAICLFTLPAWTNGQVENIMPPASLDWWKHQDKVIHHRTNRL